MSAVVRMDQGRALADSRDVADAFGKVHKSVLRSVDVLLSEREDLGHNFVPKIYPVHTAKGATRSARAFDMDRKGFMLLVMGFTGAKALSAKVEWIDAFDRMEAALLAIDADDEVDEIDEAPAAPSIGYSGDELDDLLKKLRVVRETRRHYGAEQARKVWRELGILPHVFDPSGTDLRLPDLPGAVLPSVVQWLEARTVPAPGQRVASSRLYDDYRRWVLGREHAGDPATITAFGTALSNLGVHKVKSGHGRSLRIGRQLLH